MYTDRLRQYDTGMLLVGSEVNFLHMIPPEQKSFKTLGRCTSECTEKVVLLIFFLNKKRIIFQPIYIEFFEIILQISNIFT